MEIQETGGVHYSIEASAAQMLKITKLDSLSAYTIQMKFTRFVIGISPSESTVFKNKEVDVHFIDVINEELKKDVSVESFAIIKYYLEKWFYEITTKGKLEFSYRQDYLIPSKVLSDTMKVSRATIMRLVENGMETVEGNGHARYPKHNSFYWEDGIWSSRIQTLRELFKLRNQSKEEVTKEIEEQINEYQDQYDGPFEKVFADVINGEMDVYDLEEPDDFKDWRDLLDDLEKLRGKET
ncbi:hypothetical protein [Aquibacillus salsiterrae]|uniref:Uncharacterized protein n=1 Tax=Aquibacillus salsiterrae TaxID=2950439 RepID=A0A9X4AE32_9BACI|nr:hypothetical protein [Aquibacillus salsiterrae]MDC3416302.1 hypothetical protein [Aquibacillus salsiterrae]